MIEVFVKNENISYKEVQGNNTRKATNLKALFEHKETPLGYVRRLVTKEPKWREDLQCYTQNFKNKSKIASSKNIILVD